MKKLLIIAIAIIGIVFANSSNAMADIKIGEDNNGVLSITHDYEDLKQALEKEYDINQTTPISDIQLIKTQSNSYWIIGYKEPDAPIIAVMLEKHTSPIDLYVGGGSSSRKEWCSGCNSAPWSCHLIFTGSGDPDGCSDCQSGAAGEFCNHNTSEGPGGEAGIGIGIFIERFLIVNE